MTVWYARRFASDPAKRPFRAASSDGVFQRDRARVIHSAAFRSLQGKTQIHSIGEDDFYRTRLTHSLEVAQIASGICEHLKERYKDDAEILKWIPSMSLIEAIGLAHDIGHPPFGHGGEIALNFHMRHKGGFEGNGQTLRILSHLGEYSPEQGLDVTRRTLLGVLKYPALHRDLANYTLDVHAKKEGTLNINAWRPPKCVIDDDEDAFQWILEPFTDSDSTCFTEIVPSDKGHHKTHHASFDASIMDLADDIAYGVHDFEDALALRLFSFREWKEAVVDAAMALGQGELHDNIDFYNKKLFSNANQDRKHAVSRLVYQFISHIEIVLKEQFEAPLLRFHAHLPDPTKQELKLLKDFVFNYVIRSPRIQATEFRGQQMLLKLFDVLNQNPDRLLPRNTFDAYQKSDNPKRVIADYLSQLTDTSAAKLYLNLFSPTLGTTLDTL